MFIFPTAFKCEKCDSKAYSQSQEPVCQKCFNDFVKKHIGVMVKDFNAPPYNPNDSIAYC